MARKCLQKGSRVRAKDLFTLFTGLWGHEEFDSCGHRLIKITFGAMLVEFKELKRTNLLFDAEEFNLRKNGKGHIRRLNEGRFLTSPFEFDTQKRPPLRKLYKAFVANVTDKGKKKLFNGQIAWSICSFETIGPKGHRLYWKRENLGNNKDVQYVPILKSINRKDARKFTMKEQIDIVGEDFFGGQCDFGEESTIRISCSGI